jgi:hypothetical protein
MGASATPTGLSSLRDEAPDGSSPKASIPCADGSWTKWSGGECPVAPDTRVDIRWNNGATTRNMRAGDLGPTQYNDANLWAKQKSGGHVVAYRHAIFVDDALDELEIQVCMRRDRKANVWYVASSNVPGLSLEAETAEGLLQRVADCAIELMELNRSDLR